LVRAASLPRMRYSLPIGGGGSRRLTEGGLMYSYFFQPHPVLLRKTPLPEKGRSSTPLRYPPEKVCVCIIPLRRLRRHLSRRERLD